MEKINLSELAKVITEEIYLFPEDRNLPIEKDTESHALAAEPAQASLVAEEPSAQAEEHVQKEPIQVNGRFNQGILILHEERELSEEIMQLLSNIINAVNHSMNDVGLIPSYRLEGRSLEELHELGAHKIIKFGKIRHAVDAIPAQDYQVYADQEVEFLFADPLTSIAEDKALKGKLWKALQNLFNITK